VVDPAVDEVFSRCLYKQTLLVLAGKIPFKLDIIDFTIDFIIDFISDIYETSGGMRRSFICWISLFVILQIHLAL
jgi:hypothetical protein